MGNVNQPSFTGGELKPSLHGRVDIAKYGIGCKTLLNWIIHAAGGISNRAGQKYIVKAKYDDQNAILVPFQFSTEQSYMLEFGHEYMRVYRNGGLVLNTAKNITGLSKANPAVFTSVAHGFTVGTWIFVASVSGMTQVNGRFFIVDTVPTADTFTVTDLFDNVLDSTSFDAYVSGGTASSVYEISTPYDHNDLAGAYEVAGVSQEKVGLVFTQSADVMTITHTGYQQRELSRTGHTSWTLGTISFAPNIAAPAGLGASGPGWSGGTSTLQYVVTAIDANTGEESVASTAVTTTAAKNPNSWTATDYVDLSWSAVSGASKYNVYKDKNGFYGFIGPATGVAFRDDNIEPVANDSPPQSKNPFPGADDYPGSVALHDQRVVYARTINNPDTVFMTQTSNYKNMNVSVPAKDSDALQFTIASEQVNAIKHLLSINDLIAFTGSAEWKLAGAADEALSPSTVGAFKQSGRGISHVRPLLVGNTALFGQSRGKKIRDFKYTIEADGYDGNDISILSSHLFRKTRNVDKRLKNWAYQQEPDSLVWSVHNDGSLSSLTYQREHEVWGFARHNTDGKYLDVCCIPEGDVDAVYFLTERTVNGVPRRFIERMENRDCDEDDLAYSFYVDAGVQYTGNGSYSLWGLEHLEGKSVRILADGNQLPDQTVEAGGKITLDAVYTVINVGLAYCSDVQPMDIETSFRDGSSSKGKAKRIPSVYVHVYNSRGLTGGPNENKLTELRGERTDELMNDPTRLQSKIFRIDIKADWKTQASVFLRHDAPLPCTILSITPDVEFA
jgi:hypothetical protein